MNEKKESDIYRELINQSSKVESVTFIPLQVSLFMTFFPKECLEL